MFVHNYDFRLLPFAIIFVGLVSPHYSASPTSIPSIMSALVKKRAMQALRGAFIGDAASMGTHWTYDPKEMVKLVSNVDEPEFLDPPAPKFYSAEGFPGHYKKGMLSPYGEQLLFVTEYVAATMKQDFTGKAMSEAMLEWANTFGGRPDQALKTFIENMNKVDGKWPNCGADDHEGAYLFQGKTIIPWMTTMSARAYYNHLGLFLLIYNYQPTFT